MQTKPQSGASRGARWNRWLLYSFIALPALGTQAIAGAAPKYSVIPLSPDSTTVAYINAKGQVAFETQPNDLHANFYDGHAARDLGTLGGPNATVSGLNELGQITGGANIDPAGETYHAYRWSQPSGMVDLTRHSPWQSFGVGINNKGQVVGNANSGPFTGSGALWSPRGHKLDIPIDPAAINDAETVVGLGGDSPQAVHALMWTRAGGVHDLGAIPSEDARATNINRVGHIVGTSGLQAFLWTPSQGLRNLGSGSAAGSIAVKGNDADVVVGYNRYGTDCPALHYCHGFIWTRASGFLEIISTGSPSSATSANDVNKLGQVVGSVDDHAYVWSRKEGFVDLNKLVTGGPAGLKLVEGLAISDNGSIVATGNTGLVLLVPKCTCTNQAPVVGPLTLSDAARANVPLSFSAAFQDADLRDTHKATWSWGDGSTDPGSVGERDGAGSVGGQHAYGAPGIYTARLTVTDSSGKSTSVQRKMVVYGAGAHVAAEGRFMSPPGASVLTPKHGGMGSFAILSGTTSGAVAAQDTASIEFSAARIQLRSTQVDPVSTRDGQLQYTGTGNVNGKGGYHFMLAAIPGAGSAGGKDRIRMRIWHEAPGENARVVDYDNWPAGSRSLATDGGGAVVEEGGISVQSN